MITSKIKVAIVVNDFMVGGAQKLIVDSLHHYDRSVFDMTLITLFHFEGRKTFYDLLPADVSVHALRFTGSKDWCNWWRLIKLLRMIKPSVVVSHLFFSNCIIRILKMFFGYRSIIVEHNTYVNKKKMDIFLDKLLSYVTYKIVAVSKTVLNFTSQQENISKNKFVTIYNGIDIGKIEQSKNNYIPGIRQSLNIVGKKIFLNVARLIEQKNQNLLIEAFSLFSKNHPDAVLIILGEGPLQAQLQNTIHSLGAQDVIFLLGARSDVYNFYMEAHAFVSTSTIEGLSIAYLESLAFGIPILATKTAGTDEVIKDCVNGYFVEHIIESVVSGLNKIDITAQSMKKDAIQTASQFDIRTTVQSYETLIRDSLQLI